MKRYIFGILLILLLAGCSTPPPPKPYVAPTFSAAISLPVYADVTTKNSEIQDALMSRGLVLDKHGQIVPLDAQSCGSPMAQLVTTLRQLKQNQSSIFTYSVVPLFKKDGSLVFTPKDGHPINVEQLFANYHTPVMFDMTHIGNAQLAQEWNVQSYHPEKMFLITANQQKYLNSRKLKGVANNIFVTVSGKTTSSAKAELQYMTTSDATQHTLITNRDALSTCQIMTQNTMVYVSTKKLSTAKNQSFTNLIATLPVDADFNQLKKQQSLVASGQYLTYKGDVQNMIDRCSGNQASSNQALCSSTADDRRTRRSNVIVFGGKQND